MNIVKIILEELNEVINKTEDLHPNVKGNKLIPIFLTWEEYYDMVNPGDKYHDSDSYNFNYNENSIFKCPIGSDCKIIKRKKVGKIELEYYLVKTKLRYSKFDGDNYIGTYSDDEVIKLGRNLYEYNINVVHDNVVVGSAQDEWGAALIYVVNEYKGLGIGEELVKLYRNIYPNKQSGGFTSGGYTQIRKYYNWMIKQALANGIYSDLVRKGEISKEKVNEIVKSVNKEYTFSKEKKNKLKDIYKGNNQPIYYIEDNLVIIFDSLLKDINNDSISNLNDKFIKDLIYCYVYVSDFNDYPQVLNCYGEEKYIQEAIEILATLNKNEGGLGDYYFRNFNSSIRSIMDKIWNDTNKYTIKTIKDGGYINGIDLKIIKPKKDITSKINLLKNIKTKWFKSFDKYGEIENRIHEIAYGFVD
jgi:hypothetical protein